MSTKQSALKESLRAISLALTVVGEARRVASELRRWHAMFTKRPQRLSAQEPIQATTQKQNVP